MAEYKTLVKKIPISPSDKTKQKEYLNEGELAIVDQGHSLIVGYTNDTDKTVSCELPVIVFGDHTRAVKYVNFPFGAGADGIKILQPKEIIHPKYLYYGTQYIIAKMPSKGYARHYQYVEKEDLPVPDIDEQERIVSRIEELFSQLDAGVETLKKVKEQLYVYQQAVLKDTFSICDSQLELSKLCEHVTDGDHMPPPKAESGIPFIMIANIKNNLIDWESTAYVRKDYYDNIDIKRKPINGDVLYTVTGSFGIPVMIDFNKEFCFQRHIALIRPSSDVLQKYLYYALMSPDVYAQASKVATGTAQKTVGLTVLRKIKIPFVNEKSVQCKIVSALERKLSFCATISNTIDEVLKQSDNMKNSILINAFEKDI